MTANTIKLLEIGERLSVELQKRDLVKRHNMAVLAEGCEEMSAICKAIVENAKRGQYNIV